MKMLKRQFLPIMLSILLCLASAACSHSRETTSTVPLSQEEILNNQLKSAWGGNLHYQNFVLAVGSKILFNSANGQLTIADPDGMNSQILQKQTASNFASNGEWLFYTEGLQAGMLTKINLNGSNHVRIGKANLKYLILTNDSILAIEADSSAVVQLQADGTGRKQLSDIQAVAINLEDEFLYITGPDDASGLAAVNLKTGTQEQLLQRRVSSVNIAGSWLYFADPADSYRIHALSLTEKKDWPISQFNVEKPFVVENDYLYFIQPENQNRLFRLPVNGHSELKNDAELLVDDAVNAFVVCGDRLYYQRPDSSRIYSIPVAGGQPVRIT